MLWIRRPHRPAPRLVEWAITSRCDLCCRHCYSGAVRDRELGTARALDLADRLRAGGVRAVTLSGGEPTLRRDWPLVVERLARAGVVTRMISNGQSFRPETARGARDAGLQFVWFSLDGLEATHDDVRRSPGAFGRVMAAARAARDVGLPFGFMITVLRFNRRELHYMSRLEEVRAAARWQVTDVESIRPLLDQAAARGSQRRQGARGYTARGRGRGPRGDHPAHHEAEGEGSCAGLLRGGAQGIATAWRQSDPGLYRHHRRQDLPRQDRRQHHGQQIPGPLRGPGAQEDGVPQEEEAGDGARPRGLHPGEGEQEGLV